jgi:hypothetical protein
MDEGGGLGIGWLRRSGKNLWSIALRLKELYGLFLLKHYISFAGYSGIETEYGEFELC